MIIQSVDPKPVKEVPVLRSSTRLIVEQSQSEKRLKPKLIKPKDPVVKDINRKHKIVKNTVSKKRPPSRPKDNTSQWADSTTISNDDLEELRTVYKRCKAVIKKIETKYGHLLNLENLDVEKPQPLCNSYEEAQCNCSANKKILFDDDGREIMQDTLLENHICPNKLKRRYSNIDSSGHTTITQNILSIEHNTGGPSLPDDINILHSILENEHIAKTYRNSIIGKIKSMKYELLNEVKYNKRALVEQVKLRPTEVFEFHGTNLNDLPGYLY